MAKNKKKKKKIKGDPLPLSSMRGKRILRAGFDPAQTTDDNSNHWANVDSLTADGALASGVLATLRKRCRYEFTNNAYAFGILTTLANDIVGTGPRLQLLLDDPNICEKAERDFSSWAAEINLAEKLRTLHLSRCHSGDGFAVLQTNEQLGSPIKLDLNLIEADRVTTPGDIVTQADGIEIDRQGNPVKYYVYDTSVSTGLVSSTDYQTIEAENIIHYFRPVRPGQHRGYPDMVPSISLFAQLRRYTLAVIAAAETAADAAGVVYTDAPPDGEVAQVEALDLIEFEKRMLVTMPAGWKMEQIRAQQPATTYEMFKHELIAEIARTFSMPLSVALGSSKDMNYASGRLDKQTYAKTIQIEQANLNLQILDEILEAWLREYRGAKWSDEQVRNVETWAHAWFYDGQEHVDELKAANAAVVLRNAGLLTDAEYFGKKGKDWQKEYAQLAKEAEERKRSSPRRPEAQEDKDEEKAKAQRIADGAE